MPGRFGRKLMEILAMNTHCCEVLGEDETTNAAIPQFLQKTHGP